MSQAVVLVAIMTTDGGHLIKALASAELLNLRGYLRLGPRDAIFVIAMAAIVLFAFAILRTGVEAVEAVPAIKPWAAVGWGAVIVVSAWLKPGSGAVLRLQNGIFHSWTAFGNSLAKWSAVRALALSAVVISITAIIVATVRPADALPFMILSAVGAATAAAVCFRLYVYGAAPAQRTARLKWPVIRWPTTPVWTILLQRLRRRFGFMPAWLLVLALLVVGSAVGGLAAYNNHSPGAGFTVVSGVALISGGMITFPDLALVRLAARQPVSIRRLLSLLCLPPLGLVAALTFAANLAAGLGLAMAVSSAVFVAGVLAVWLLLLMPQAMMRSPRGAVGLAAGDLVMALIIKSFALFGLLAVVYLVVRIVLNLRAVAHGRWREAG